jgi:hypothetical protein
VAQSFGHFVADSPLAHTLSPQAWPQSELHVAGVSDSSQTPSPHLNLQPPGNFLTSLSLNGMQLARQAFFNVMKCNGFAISCTHIGVLPTSS